jgi:putative phosphoribosyl transferase
MSATPQPRHKEVRIATGDVYLDALLVQIPAATRLIVLLERGATTLIDGRGSVIAAALQLAGMSTLQVALLSREEERRAPDLWHQVAALVPRIEDIATWVARKPELAKLTLALLARDAAAGAMVRVAAHPESPFVALACRAGRPDLAGLEPLQALRTPLLMVTGELDEALPANRLVDPVLTCPHELAIIPGASHTLAEPGALDEASRLLVAWFQRWPATNSGH